MFISWRDPAVRLTGRWSRLPEDTHNYHKFHQVSSRYTTTTTPGSYLELAFGGKEAVLQFDLGFMQYPFPHLYISVDGGARVEVPVDRYLRVRAETEGNHIVKVIYKGGMEQLNRWYLPLSGCISFIGAEAERTAVLPEDSRRIIEFIGDSITEGVLTDADYYSDRPAMSIDQFNRPYEDDNTATYGWLTAEKLNLRPIFQAYGAVGLTREGCASVPRAGLIYPYVFDGIPYTGEKPDIVVINHGANDRAASEEEYILRYRELVDQVFENTPDAIVVCLGAFCGAFDSALAAFEKDYNANGKGRIHFVSTKGWVPLEPLHPLRGGHRTISENFVPILKEIIG